MENFSSIARAWEDITLDNYLDSLEDEMEEELEDEEDIADDIRAFFYRLIDLGKEANKRGMVIKINYNLQDLIDGKITFEDLEEEEFLIKIYKEV